MWQQLTVSGFNVNFISLHRDVCIELNICNMNDSIGLCLEIFFTMWGK